MTGDLFAAAGIADQLDAPDGRVKLCAACGAERPYRRGLCPRCLAAGYDAPTLTAGTGTIHTPGTLDAEPIGRCGVCGTANQYEPIRRTFDCSPLMHGLQTPAHD